MLQVSHIVGHSFGDVSAERSERTDEEHLDERHGACKALLEAQQVHFCFFEMFLEQSWRECVVPLLDEMS